MNVKKIFSFFMHTANTVAAVAAIVFAGRVGSVHTGATLGYELMAIAALMLGVLHNGLTLLGVQAYWHQILESMIIIVAAVIIDMRKNAKKK